MSGFRQLGESFFESERKNKWVKNSKKLSEKYFMSEDIFKSLVGIGQNPKKFLGATELLIGRAK